MTSLVFNNFVRGKLDRDLNGRFDLPIFSNGFPVIKNFVCNYKGNLKYRTGFEFVANTRSNNPARLIQFRFNTKQTYLLELTEKYIRFYSYDKSGNFGYVSNSSGGVLELNTQIPYSACKGIQVTQNADVMYLTESSIKPQKLTRTSATAFNMVDVAPSGIDYNTTGYPRSATFYKSRLWMGGFAKKVTTIKASRVADYENFTIPTENIKDDDPLSLQLTEITDPISWIVGGKRNLIVGNTEGISVINGGNIDTTITSTAVNADLANKEGASSAIPTEKDSQMIYIGTDKTKVYAFDYDLVSETFVSTNLNLLSEELGQIEELYYKRDNNNLIYGRTSKGQMIALLYNKSENIVGFFPIETNGEVLSMCTLLRPDGKDDLFISVKRHGICYIERMTDEIDFTNFYDTDYEKDPNKENYNRLQLEELKKAVYVDNGVTYKELHNETITIADGKAKSEVNAFTSGMIGYNIVYKTITGKEYGTAKITGFISAKEVTIKQLTQKITPATHSAWYLSFDTVGDLQELNGTTQSVVADGGYIGDFVVTNGQIKFDRDYTSVTIGFGYKGFAKSFNLGIYDSGVNYQTLKKRISSFTIRFVDSAGFKVGTSLDNLQVVQSFNPQGFYDSTPLLMNSDEYIYGYNDDHNKVKYIYFVQDMPLPCNITMLEYKISFESLER